MLLLSNCGIEPGDILLVVSNSRKFVVKLEQFFQALKTSGAKHGHKEVISVFVCTGKNKYGVICHNFEQQLALSQDALTKTLQKKSTEELCQLFVNYYDEICNVNQINSLFKDDARWIQDLSSQMHEKDSSEELIARLLALTQEDKEKLIQTIIILWQISGQSAILPSTHSSLLVFKHTDSIIRQKFLTAYLNQVKVTEQFHKLGKHRASFFQIIKSFFSSTNQDQKDRENSTPSEKTYCSRHLMQVLNQVDPDLVHRGRNVLPKTLEAGLREATKNNFKTDNDKEQLDDFELLIAKEEQLLPPFKMFILPATGTELISTLIKMIDQEIDRIEHKLFPSVANQQKSAELKKLLLPYRDHKFQSYSVDLQVDISLKLIAALLPTLQRKTGLFGTWLPSTSYTKIKDFAKTQGIFGVDIGDAIEREKLNYAPKEKIGDSSQNKIDLGTIYIFSDWSFSSWSPNKRKRMLEHMMHLFHDGHSLYLWENEQLIKMNKESLCKAINDEDFDNLLAPKLKPATQATIIQKAVQQKIDITRMQFLDYITIKKILDDNEPIEVTLNKVSPLFASNIDEYHLNEIKEIIIDIEIANVENNKNEQAELYFIKEKLIEQKNLSHKTYRSGIDTKASAAHSSYKKPIFKPVDLMVFTPSNKYYRNEVYTDLFINENPSSPFQYFELQGMNATEKLVDCQYIFHLHGLTKEVIDKRKAESTQRLFKGEKQLTLTQDWQVLPSLDPDEKLLDIAINYLKAQDFQIKYSKENHLYYIRLANKDKVSNVTVNLLLQMPKHYANPIFNTINPIPHHRDIYFLLIKYLKFGGYDDLLWNKIGITVHNGHAYLNEARKLKIGSCRLRAIAFKEEMKHLHPEIPVNVVVNGNHCFIEMELDHLSYKYCLGGYRDRSNVLITPKMNTFEHGELKFDLKRCMIP